MAKASRKPLPKNRSLAAPRTDAAARQLLVLGFSSDEVRALATGPRLVQLAEILALARQAYGQSAAQWLLTPEERLGNVLPATLLRDPHNGPNLVKQVLLNSLRGTIA
jgi:uncharacterized protein (DUF2384 family)